jgi:glucosamine-6-phosphate deaminase
MDEYVGLSIAEKQSFAGFVKSRVVDNFNVKAFYPINGANANVDLECERYAKLLEENKVDIVCCGIGENGHLAFNDPGVADFGDKKAVKVIELDDVCRNQQVHDGCFATIDDVPKKAITLTIPTLISADEIICVVPCKTKSQAVYQVIKGEVTEDCPASVLRRHKNAMLYCDKDSAEKVI